jgi:hypothetical protein
MKDKEKEEDFNIKLIQSLDRNRKKMDKEDESRNSVSHRSCDER